MPGRKIERKLQIDQAESLAAAAAQDRAKTVEHFGSTQLRAVCQKRQALARIEVVNGLGDQGMVWQDFVEGAIDLERFVPAFFVALACQIVAVSLHDPQLTFIELVGALQPLAGFPLLAGCVEDHPGMEALEDVVPVRSDKLVDRIDGGLELGRACLRPSREKRAGEIGNRGS